RKTVGLSVSLLVQRVVRSNASRRKESTLSLPAKRRTGLRSPPKNWASTSCSLVITPLKLSASKPWRLISRKNLGLIGNSSVCQQDSRLLLCPKPALYDDSTFC